MHLLAAVGAPWTSTVLVQIYRGRSLLVPVVVDSRPSEREA
jgi:hypothetical protein